MSTIISIKEVLDTLPSTKKLLVWKDSFQYHFQIVDKKEGSRSVKHKHSQHKGIFVLDTQTEISYISRAECGRQLANLVNKLPNYPNIYYLLKKKFPHRFVDKKG